ncbi:MAG: hypothetical protein EBV19_09405, partial [Flavobacteriia bacterium]|nr:hypothetical protein [Flavobacteriia bacterium]
MQSPKGNVWYVAVFIFGSIVSTSLSQRLVLPPTPEALPPAVPKISSGVESTPAENSSTLILKTYPDGTKKIVPLEALNFRD